MKWLKSLSKHLSDVAWKLGWEELSLKLLLWSLETDENATVKPRIDLFNQPPHTSNDARNVVYKDRQLVVDLQPWQQRLPRNATGRKIDIN